MPAPLLNFTPYNPMDLAIQTALGTYKGIGAGRQQQLQNQKADLEMPFVEQNAQNDSFLKAIQAKYAEQETLAKINHMKQQDKKSQYDIENPGTRGIAAQLLQAKILRDKGDPNSIKMADTIERGVNSQISSHTPVVSRVNQIAMLKGMGYTDQEAADLTLRGISLEEAGAAKGLSPEESLTVKKDFPLTTPNQTQYQRREGGTAEALLMDEWITPRVAEYYTAPAIPTVYGMPIGFAIDQTMGVSRDKRIRYLEGTMMNMEQAATRLKQAALEGGVTQTLHQLQTTLTNQQAPANVPAKDWAEAQRGVSKFINELAKVYNEASSNSYQYDKSRRGKQVEVILNDLESGNRTFQDLTDEEWDIWESSQKGKK